MGRTNDKPLKEVIDELLRVYKLRRKYDETALIQAWPDVIGVAIANRTSKIYIRDRKLFVQLESSVIRNELMMMRSHILERMNEIAGSKVIDEVILV